ncbi:MAG TPA: tannase/feruloyl esterase family alpha/beta hydrolase [Steroidobacteraceae bacterium]|nr:tannase/feruloyl esterase family alpha/beta hydrolase [Steroidobacteraceae bacterium]
MPPVELDALPAIPTLAPVMTCAALGQQDFTSIALAPTSIASASVEAAQGKRSEFCLIKGIIAPQIQFELRLPTQGYTGRYLQAGCGGACGVLREHVSPPCESRRVFDGSFAVSFENSGHVGADLVDTIWALHAPQLRRDFAYRAAHVMAIVAKTLLSAYYGRPPVHSYFIGCSDGGREGLTEAQRYPDDFDGIVVGAPAYFITQMPLRIIWESQHGLDENDHPVLTEESLSLLHRAVLAACDALDGLQDGQIDDPRACHYDPSALVCRPGQTTSCITRTQSEAMRAYYSGPVDERGRHLYLGGEPYGSELTWRQAFSSMGATLGTHQIRFMIYDGEPPAGFNWRTWKPDAAALADLFRRGGYYNASNPDLRRFRAAGGKLVIWQGAADSAAGPYALFDYYQRVRDVVGGFAGSQAFMRVFLIPGVYHCEGGYVPYQEDFLGPVVRWVEQGIAPESILATAQLPDGAVRRRPVYAYPERTRFRDFRGADINRPESFTAQPARQDIDDHYDWLGAAMTNGPAP